MDRLTRWVPTTVHGQTVAQTAEPTCDAKIADVIRRLAEYEDLGITPDKIKRLYGNLKGILLTQKLAIVLCDDRLCRDTMAEINESALHLINTALEKAGGGDE